MGDRLVTTDMCQKVGAVVPLFVGVPNVAWAEAYLRTKAHASLYLSVCLSVCLFLAAFLHYYCGPGCNLGIV